MNKNLNFSCEEDNLLIAAHLRSDSLPKLLKDCIDLGKTPEEKDIVLLSALTAASAVLPHYFFRYGHGGKKYYPNLQTFIMAGAASGKGMASVGLDLVRDIHKEHEILIPGDSTYPAFFTQLWAQDGIGYMPTEEVLYCPERFFRTALLITGKLILHAADAYNQIEGQKQQAVPERKGSYQKQMLLQSLPEEFETGMCIAESKKIGIHERTARRWIEYWTEAGMICKVNHGCYRKVA